MCKRVNTEGGASQAGNYAGLKRRAYYLCKHQKYDEMNQVGLPKTFSTKDQTALR